MTSNSSQSTVINELLAYVTFYRKPNATTDYKAELKRIISQFYSFFELSTAAAVLRSTFPDRRQSNDSSTAFSSSSSAFGKDCWTPGQQDVNDIMRELDVLDQQGLLKDTSFVAKNLERLPRCSPSNLNSAINRQFKGFDELSNPLANVTISRCSKSAVNASPVIKAVADTDRKLTDTIRALEAQVQQANEALRALSIVFVNRSRYANNDTLPRNALPSAVDDSADTVVITGLQDEQNELINWRSHVDSILLSIAGHKVDIIDTSRMFGGWKPKQTRPVLVRLRWAQDRELLLARRNILKQPHPIFGKVRIHPGGVSETTRRMRTLECLRRKAELDRASATVDGKNGILWINGIRVFSVQFGFAEEWHARAGTTSVSFKPLYTTDDTSSMDDEGRLIRCHKNTMYNGSGRVRKQESRGM
jgi:hypothetical protein